VVVAGTSNSKNDRVLTPGSTPSPDTTEPEKSNPPDPLTTDGVPPTDSETDKDKEPKEDKEPIVSRPGIDVNLTLDNDPVEDTTA
jgi:hypothetical protein